jgi:ribosomal protein S8
VKSKWQLAAMISLSLALSTSITGVDAQAASPPAASIGLSLTTIGGRLVVVAARDPLGTIVLKTGDMIVAVNGQSVNTEASFMNLLTRARAERRGVNITVSRNGITQVAHVAPANRTTANRSIPVSASGIMNPDLMVMTSRGVMHRDAARRVGLEGTPVTGTPDRSYPLPDFVTQFGNAAAAAQANRTLFTRSGGILNPDDMVMTSQGVMHREAARRLGLEGTPIAGTPERSFPNPTMFGGR